MPFTSIAWKNTMEVNGYHQLFGNQHSSKYLLLCSAEERNSYRFRTDWGWVNNNRIFILVLTIPLMYFILYDIILFKFILMLILYCLYEIYYQIYIYIYIYIYVNGWKLMQNLLPQCWCWFCGRILFLLCCCVGSRALLGGSWGDLIGILMAKWNEPTLKSLISSSLDLT